MTTIPWKQFNWPNGQIPVGSGSKTNSKEKYSTNFTPGTFVKRNVNINVKLSVQYLNIMYVLSYEFNVRI